MSAKKQKQLNALKTILDGGVPEEDIKVYKGNKNAHVDKPFRNRPSNPEVGDTWTDDKGKVWEQRNGYVASVPKMQAYRLPAFCPECDRTMGRRIDKKFWYIHGKCSMCVVEYETELRAKGLYELYEKVKIEQNVRAWIRDMRSGLKDFRRDVEGGLDFAFEDGRVEKWKGLSEDKIESMIENAEQTLQAYEDKADDLRDQIEELKSEKGIDDVSEII